MKNHKFAPLFLSTTLLIGGCGGVRVLGVDIDLRPGITMESASKYDDTLIYATKAIDKVQAYLELIESTKDRIVEDEYGYYFHKRYGSRVAAFYISKTMGNKLRADLSSGKIFVVPMYRSKAIQKLPRGTCGSQSEYDRDFTLKWINNLNEFKLSVVPIDASDGMARFYKEFEEKQHEQEKKYAADFASLQISYTEGASIYVTDSSFQSRRYGETRRCSTDAVFANAERFKLLFFSKDVIASSNGSNAHGVVSASCSVTSWDNVISNAGRRYVTYENVERERLSLENAALKFCSEAMEAFNVSRKITSGKLR